MAIVILPVEFPDYAEMAGSPEQTFTEDGFEATRKLLVNWEDRHQLANALAWTTYPYLPAMGAYVRSISIVPAPAKQLAIEDTNFVAYEAAIVTVGYSISPDDPQTADLVTESLEPNAEMRTLDFEDFRWGAVDGDVLKEDEAPSQLLRSHDYVLTFHRLLSVPIEVIDLEGFVNEAVFETYTLGLSYPIETLLYAGGSPSRKITTDGSEAFSVTNRFQYRKTEWNKFFRQKTQAYEEMFHKDGDRYRNYPLGDFSALLP
jgi:hypothetical protein